MKHLNPSDKDVNKLHAEINQLINQRFTLNTVALTITGAMSAYIIPKEEHINSIVAVERSIMGDIVLLLFLCLLVYLSRILYTMLRTFTTYLRVTEKSNWEQDWYEYQKLNNHSTNNSEKLIIKTTNWIKLNIIFKNKPSESHGVYSSTYKIYFLFLGIASSTIPTMTTLSYIHHAEPMTDYNLPTVKIITLILILFVYIYLTYNSFSK